MNFYWYWPFARPEELDWARHTVRPGERITVHVVDRPQSPTAACGSARVHVVRDLPDVDATVWPFMRPLSRSRTYVGRALKRRRAMRSSTYDLAHIHYLNRFTDAVMEAPYPTVVSVHDVFPHVRRLPGPLEHQLLTACYRRADALVVHHERLAQRLHAEFEIDPGKVFVVPHQVFDPGVDVERPPPGRPSVLFFGTLRPNKGLEVLFKAVEHLKGHEIDFVIAGRGDARLEGLVQDEARRLNLRAEIGYASLDHKRLLFRNATLVALPYTAFESQSGVLHDAYGHGRPVVVTDVGALGAAVREDGTGAVVSPGDSEALASAILSLVQPEAWNAAHQACVRVASDRSPVAVGARLRSVYDEVLAASD